MSESIADTYKTITKQSEGLYKDRGSKFLAYAHPIKNEEEVKKLVGAYKKEYHNARHHCYAFKYGTRDEYYRFNDDGEPSGTAGKPIYGQILSHDLTNICIVVVRYFGGTLLGTSGLINAYKQATIEAIKHNKITEKTINDIYEVDFSYDQINVVMNQLKTFKAIFLKETYLERCQIKFAIRLGNVDKMLEIFHKQMININFIGQE